MRIDDFTTIRIWAQDSERLMEIRRVQGLRGLHLVVAALCRAWEGLSEGEQEQAIEGARLEAVTVGDETD
jgi:hypothetical protein